MMRDMEAIIRMMGSLYHDILAETASTDPHKGINLIPMGRGRGENEEMLLLQEPGSSDQGLKVQGGTHASLNTSGG